MEQKPGLFWGMIVSMWIGNLMLVVLNLPLIGIWVRMLLVPYRLLADRHPVLLLHRRLQPQQLRQRGAVHRLLRRASATCS